MNKFYFFKVVLSYFDDERKTFFITPDQSETDEDGIPFSENDLRNTAEFKEFIKKTKADVIDVDYVEYAVEYDPKKSEIINKPITDEIFKELEKDGQLEIVDENQFLILVKIKKQSSGGASKVHIVCLIVAAVIVLGVLAAGVKKNNTAEDLPSDQTYSSDSSDLTETDESSEDNSDDTASGTEEISEPEVTSSSDNTSDNSSDITESAVGTSSDVGNTHEPAESTSTSGGSTESGSDSSSDNSDNSDEVSTPIQTDALFNLETPSNMAVTINFDIEEPSVYFIDPTGNVITQGSYTVERRDGAVVCYIPNAAAGQWMIGYDKKSNTTLDINWSPYNNEV